MFSLFGSTHFNDIKIGGLKKALDDKLNPEENEFKGVKVGFSLDYSGLGVVESLTNTISGFFSGEGKKDEGDTTEGKVEDPTGKSAGTNQDQVKLSVTRDHKDIKPVSVDEVNSSIRLLERFEKEEVLRAERHSAENELEAFAFEASTLIDEEKFILHSNEVERQKLQAEVTRVRAWLEDDTQPSTPTKDFKDNYKKIKEIVGADQQTNLETQNRPPALEELEKLINTTIQLVTLTKANFTETATVTEGKEVKAVNDEIASFSTKIDKLVTWLTSNKKQQANLPINEDSVLKTEDIKSKTSALQRAFAQHFQKLTRLTEDVVKAKKKAEREAKKKAAEEKKETTESKAEPPSEEPKETQDGKVEEEKTEL
ncbi:unnamed protein product, partial [Mesorhabditis belari]|uniref:Hypoxia up-regulated protein 1 n=1 Tax=Mesorhabditis belari TaxID=2138241 RepID=A0AAF3F966_9BILA